MRSVLTILVAAGLTVLAAGCKTGSLCGCQPPEPPTCGSDPFLPGPWACPAFGACYPDPLFVSPVDPHCGAYLGGTANFLPNVGLGIEGGYVFHKGSRATWAVEAQGVWQFLDDKTFADNGDPTAGDWWQARVGLKIAGNPEARRHWTLRAGAVAFRANGVPNWVDEPGNYYGAYIEPGFETDLSENVTIGPGLSIMPVWEEADSQFHVVPMLNLHVNWWLCPLRRAYRGCGEGPGCSEQITPPGEIYADFLVDVGPNVGLGLGGGQVFARDRKAVWSFELDAAFEPFDDFLLTEGTGSFAQVRGGLKLSFCPRACHHPTLRVGATWFRTTAPISTLDESPGDYLGGYAGVGYEWDLGSNFSMGPEISAAVVSKEREVTLEVLPRFSWHFIFKF